MEPLEYEIKKWRDYAKTLGLANSDQAEKDYLQELMLFELFSGRLGGLLVLRGGTAISKLYGSGRFSEDIDLVLKKDTGAQELELEIEKALKGLNFYYPTEYTAKHYRNMLKYSLKIKGPIYSVANNEQAKQSIKLDINTYERPIHEVRSFYRTTVYEDVKPYMLAASSQEELLADKIKSMLERTEPAARDLYDAWVLIKKYRIKPDLAIADKKMREYGKRKNERFSMEELFKKVAMIGRKWDAELSRLIKAVPDFNTVDSEFRASLQ